MPSVKITNVANRSGAGDFSSVFSSTSIALIAAPFRFVEGSALAKPLRFTVPPPGPRTLRPEPVDSYKITTLHPRNYNDARTVGEYFREGTPVIMNLTDMDDSDAKRLVDFSAGLIFGLHGSIERVTAKVFLLSPANVVVTAEEKARLAEGGFFNQS